MLIGQVSCSATSLFTARNRNTCKLLVENKDAMRISILGFKVVILTVF